VAEENGNTATMHMNYYICKNSGSSWL